MRRRVPDRRAGSRAGMWTWRLSMRGTTASPLRDGASGSSCRTTRTPRRTGDSSRTTAMSRSATTTWMTPSTSGSAVTSSATTALRMKILGTGTSSSVSPHTTATRTIRTSAASAGSTPTPASGSSVAARTVRTAATAMRTSSTWRSATVPGTSRVGARRRCSITPPPRRRSDSPTT